jgi:hypothetical protein
MKVFNHSFRKALPPLLLLHVLLGLETRPKLIQIDYFEFDEGIFVISF